ncbi:MAG: PA domain-containing protein, partial [Saprospiraceae bacterium]
MPLQIFSQNLNTLTVNEPSVISGGYPIAQVEWSIQSNINITAEAVYARPELGCETITNNVSEKIVFVDRDPAGTCAFDVKALNAQNAGAVAVIICNIVAMETLQFMGAGTVTAQVTIPVFNASLETCTKLKVDLGAGGINATLSFKCDQPIYASNAVWGTNHGEGDFSNGLDTWTTDKGWVANAEGVIRLGAYMGNPRVVGSATACNGVAEFNADYLDTRGTAGAFGTGDCPAPCTGYLLSPNITLANPLGGLTIEFTQSLRQFQSQYYMMVSKDGGVTFSDTVQLNTEYPVNSIHLTERKRVAFTGYSGVTQLRFKFELIGNFYYWGIDDIVVYDESFVKMEMNKDWYSVSPYYKMPSSQVSEIPFMADIKNTGNSIAKDVKTTINIKGPSTNQSFELNYSNFPASSIWENRPFPLAYISPSHVGTYQAEYVVNADEENNSFNNRAGFHWHVTNHTFANLDNETERGSLFLYGFYPNFWISLPEPRIYSIANVFYVPNGEKYEATKVRYGLTNTLAQVIDQAIRIDLFEWVDLDNSNTASPEERIRVGTSIQVISDDLSDLRNIETDIWAADEDGFAIEGERVKLKDKTHYIIAASVSPNSPETDPIMGLLCASQGGSDNFTKSLHQIRATNFALDTLAGLGILGPRASGSLMAWENIENTSVTDIDKRNFRYIYNGNLYMKSFIEMDIGFIVNIDEVRLPHLAVKTFPNPAARDLFVDIKLENTSIEVQVTMFDVEGKLVSTRTFNNVQDDRLKLDVSTLTNGVYTVNVVTEE